MLRSSTPCQPNRLSAKSEKQRELFPDDGCSNDTTNFVPLNEETALKLRSDDLFVSDSATNNTSGRKRFQISDSFDTTEDKENVLPSFCNVGTSIELKMSPEKPTELDRYQTQEQFDADLKLAIALSLQNQEIREGTEHTKLVNMDTSEEDGDVQMAVRDDEDDDSLIEALDRIEAEELAKAAEAGDLPHSYRLMSIVSHLGDSSSIGHYVTDVYDINGDKWYTCDDSNVTITSEENVRLTRQRNGYIFFYLNKDLVKTIKDCKETSGV